MKLTFNQNANRFELACAFADREIAKQASFRWDAEEKKWYTQNAGIAARLRHYADALAEKEIRHGSITVEPFTGRVPVPSGKKLYGFQEVAARFALARNRSYLALDAGLGKTAAVIAAANADPGPMLYITPPFLRLNVLEELAMWQTEKYPVTILPDSMAAKRAATFSGMPFKWVVIDEAHRFKTPDAQRTVAVLGDHKAIAGLAQRGQRVVCLSGTPMPNRPVELFPILRALAPDSIGHMSFFDFALKYCGAHRSRFGWDFSGATNVPELSARIKERFMLRMRKHEVLSELPAKTEQIIFIDDVQTTSLLSLQNQLLAKTTVEKIVKENGLCPGAPEYRKALGIEKASQCAEFVKSILDENPSEAILLFAWHRDVIARLSDELSRYRPFVITGDTPMDRRHAMVKEFQESDTRRLFIGNIAAMGVGLTLTKATRVIFAEYSWVPAENEQASDRAHRIGQKGNVLVQYLAIKDSLDAQVLRTLLRKSETINKLIG